MPPVVAVGMMREVPQPERRARVHVNAARRASCGRRRRRVISARGRSSARRIVVLGVKGVVCGVKGLGLGVEGFVEDAVVVEATSVSRVTAMRVVVPRETTAGTTLQVELAGAPVQVRAMLPVRLASEVSCMG
jgi:hypothetical protein